ncbi:MAG TPA: high-affinity branched-chain amino acid ABC transporter permease LivM [Alphaproteobacteria bacterium]|nr:high-affinity branched-chain amino acid ABC transporter permease LivM [Alphaproteobacteria bacterium]
MAVADEALAGPRPLNWRAILIEAALTAFVVFLLTIALVGADIVDFSDTVTVRPRLNDVIAAVIIAFLGRIVLVLLREGRNRIVLATMVPLALATFLILLGGSLGIGADLRHLLPFRDPVVCWIIDGAMIVFALRALWTMRRAVKVTLSDEAREARADRTAARVQRVARMIGPLIFVAALALPLTPLANRQILDIGTLVMTYIMLGWGLNVVVGLAGLLDLGYVAFYAVGAYSFALLAQFFGLGFWTCLPFAGLMSGTAGVLLGFPVLRLRGDYLAIVTLGFGEMVRLILNNWQSLTGGPNGISGVPRPTFFGLPLLPFVPEGHESFFTFFHIPFTPEARIVFLYYVILGLAMITNLFTMRIRRLPIGRAWEALREDEIACRSLGINPRNTKLTAFGIGAMFAGFAGSFFATRQGFISPESFTFIESAVILAIVVLGGFGSQLGVVFAAIILIGLPEFFRELQLYRMLAFGAAMVTIMIWRPAGLLAHREPTLKLFGAKSRGGAK